MKKTRVTGKIVREIMVAARMGGPDPEGNARLAAAAENAANSEGRGRLPPQTFAG